MSIISWIILGLIAGFIGSKIVNKQGQGLLLDVALGVVGAIVGGIIIQFFWRDGDNRPQYLQYDSCNYWFCRSPVGLSHLLRTLAINRKGCAADTHQRQMFASSEMIVSMIFPTRFPTELLDTGWENATPDGL